MSRVTYESYEAKLSVPGVAESHSETKEWQNAREDFLDRLDQFLRRAAVDDGIVDREKHPGSLVGRNCGCRVHVDGSDTRWLRRPAKSRDSSGSFGGCK